MDQDFVPALYGNVAKDMSGTPFRLRDTLSEVNFKRSYQGFRLALPSFYGRLVDAAKPAWEPGNYEEKDANNAWQSASFDVHKISTFKIPEVTTDDEGNEVSLTVTANDGTRLTGVVYGRQKTGNDKPWTPGNYEVCVVTKWKTVGKGQQAEDPTWLDCDYDRLKEFHLMDERNGKPTQDKPEKFTTFHIAFKDPVTLHRKDKDGQPVEKEALAVELEAPHYLALALHAKIADKSEDGGNPLNYWMTWHFDAAQSDNALKWSVKANKMAPEDVAAVREALADGPDHAASQFKNMFGEEMNVSDIEI